MKTLINRIRHSEFLTFSEVLRLKVTIVNVFLMVFVLLSVFVSKTNNFSWNMSILIPVGFGFLLVFTFLLTVVNLNRFAMHISILTIIGLTAYYISGSDYFFTYILFFVSLTVIIFYQDILTYLLYGGFVTIAGVYYVYINSAIMIGANSTHGIIVSSLTYQAILIGFYVVFLIQFLLSDSIYEKLNNEYVRMNKALERYQDFSYSHLSEIQEKKKIKPIYENPDFQKAISELSIFINEFFEEKGDNIAEVVEFYFFLHSQEVEEVIEDAKLPSITRRYSLELKKYLLNYRSELYSILYEFTTLFKGDDHFDEQRYEYNLDKLFENRIDKLLSLAILYKYLKTEVTQYDKWSKINRKLTHEEITEMFVSKEFREFISFEQVNFYLDNEELFKDFL